MNEAWFIKKTCITDNFRNASLFIVGWTSHYDERGKKISESRPAAFGTSFYLVHISEKRKLTELFPYKIGQ